MNFDIIPVYLADASAAGAAGTDPAAASCAGMGGIGTLIYCAAILAICYFILIKPQKKKQAAEEQLRKSIEVGDEIITIGGICGRVVSIKEDETIVIETGADRNKLKMKTWAISSNVTAKSRQAENEPAKKEGFFAKLFSKKETPED